jgi:hypothetical protein
MCCVIIVVLPSRPGSRLTTRPSIVSPRYCATPSERTPVFEQLIDQAIREPRRSRLSIRHCGPNSTGTTSSASTQAV